MRIKINPLLSISTMTVLLLFLNNVFSEAQPECDDVVIGKYINIFSKILNEERTILVQLPQSYEKAQDRYPGIYCLDGDNLSLAFVAATVRMLSHRKIPEMFVVAIANTDRSRDMFPVRLEGRPTTGGADKFLGFLNEELIPFVDQNYRTENFRVLYGASAAGLFTVYALLARPDSFSAYIASSPMIGRCPEFISKKTKSLFDSGKSLRKILYITYGKDDAPPVTEAVPSFVKTIETAKPKDFKWKLKIIEDEGHVPYTSLYDGLKFIFSHLGYSSK